MDARLNTLHNLIREVTGHSPYAEPLVVRGSGGGGSKGGSGGANSSPDTLFSTATIRLVDLLAEGEIVGVKGGFKGVYLNDITVQNADGSFNFKGVTGEFRNGTPDQQYMAGYPDVQTPHSVGVRATQQTPVVASISETEATRVRVTLQFPALFLSKNDGTVSNNTVQYRVEARYSGGPWVNQIGDQTLTGKTTSGYYRSHEVNLPVNPSGASAPWQVRVSRLSADTDDFNNRQSKYTNQSDIIFASTTSITDAKFTYGNSAVVGLTAQASLFGSSVPGRTYLVDGAIMPVPSNYDPVARTYSGVWDGTFKQGFCNNPAWALYLILSNDRFGLGDVIDTTAIDKWSLYEIGRYCDVLVGDGKGGQEPRFTFNGVISTQQEAFELLQLIAQIFQGFTYWSSGTVTATQDRPTDPVLLVTEANVVEGDISYASSGRRARHTVAIVAWNDPSNLYKQEYEVVEATELDSGLIARYGYNPVRVDVLGCTSRGQAHRAGLWKLFTELYQTQIATYRAGLDHAVARPGDVVAIQDPQIANIDVSGRLLAGSTASNLLLDRPVTLASGSTYKVSVTLTDGTVKEATVSSSTTGTVTALPLSPALPSAPDPAAIWILAGPVAPRQFRIVSIKEDEPHIYSVTAIQHEPGKYATIDNGAKFEAQTYSTFPDKVAAPTNVTVRESQYTELGQAKQGLTLSWTAGEALTTYGYYVAAIRPSGAVIELPKRTSATADFQDVENGEWTFIITAIGLNGKLSTPTQYKYTVVGWAGQALTTVTGLQVRGGGSTFSGRACTVNWTNTIPTTVSPYPVTNTVYVFSVPDATLLHTEVLPVGQTEWTYDYQVNLNEGGPRRQFRVAVSARSAAGQSGPLTSLTVSNPAPGAIVPNLTATSENVFVNLPNVSDPDFSGYLVWVSPTSGFTPTDANVSADSPSTFQSFKGANNTTYYVRVAAYDAFSKAVADLNVSPEYNVTCTSTAFDTSAPNIPSGVTVTSNGTDVAPDGTVTSKVKVSWNTNTAPNLGKYEVAFAIGSGAPDTDYIGGNFVTGTSITRQGFVPGVIYSVKVRAISTNGFGISGWSTAVTFTAALNTAPPNPVTALSAVSAVKNAFVTWTNPTNTDFLYVEVYASSDNNLANATRVATVAAPTSFYTDPNLPNSGTRYYWVRSFNSSKVGSTNTVGPVQASPAALPGSLIAAQTIAGDRLLAGTVTANEIAAGTITVAKMAAGVLTADTITVGNGTISSFINGTNSAKLSPTALSVNSISTNYLRVGARGIRSVGIEFSMGRDGNGAVNNVFSWTSGFVLYTANAGNAVSNGISAGSVNTGGNYYYVYWNIDNPTVLTATADEAAVRNDQNNVIMAASSSATGVQVFVGGVVIDGTKVTALSISAGQIAANAITAGKIAANAVTADTIAANAVTADKLAANSVTAGKIAANTITAVTIAANAVTADKLGAGTISAGTTINVGSRVFIEALSDGTGRMRVLDSTGQNHRVALGQLSALTGINPDYGLICWGGDNQVKFRVTGNTTYIAGAIIGDLEVTNIKIANGAISNVVTASTTDTITALQITNRSSSSRYQISALFRGSGNETTYLQGSATGQLILEYSTDGQNFAQLEVTANIISYIYSQSVNASYKIYNPTIILTTWSPGYGGPALVFRLRDTNGPGIGGLYLSVTELAK